MAYFQFATPPHPNPLPLGEGVSQRFLRVEQDS